MGHAEDLEIIKGSKVLMVGAGGIGCELLKTLALTGFKDIHVIDMDTIEVSNLNRQFLFRKTHVGEPKAKVAREAVLKFCPSVNITAYHANVKDSEFNVEFFQQFNVILNGLDNLDARRHVNRLCLSAEVPLVESGTTGFLGQVTVHVKGLTECYECYPKPTPKTYPVCTITNTPTKFVHCIVWAKELLFARLFGDRSQATDLNAQSNENTDGSEGGSDDVFVIQEGESLEDYGKKIFDHVFAYNIESALKKEEMWKKRKAPTPLYIKDILGTVDKEVNGTLPSTGCKSNKQILSAMNLLGLKNPQDIWSVGDNAKVFLKALQLFFEERKEEFRNLTFDKDDQLAVEFVSSAANIRAASFGIPMQSLFEAKGIAGNIIHAVATTNAIIAGLIVIEAVKLLKCDSKSYRMTYCLEHPNRKHLLMPAEPFQPNKTCYVCSKTPISLEINTHEAKLKDLIEKVIKNKLGISSPMIMYGYTILYESDEGLENESTACYMSNSKKTLAEILDPSSNCISIEDLQQDFSCDIHIKHRDDFEEESEGFILSGVNSSSKAETNVNSEGGGENVSTDAELNRNDDSDVECLAGGDLEIVEQSLEAQTVFNAGSSRKRKLDTDSNDDEVVLLIDAHPVPEKRARHQ